MNLQRRIPVALLVVGLGLLSLSCRPGTGNPSAPNAAAQKPTPKYITPPDLARLRWIEGSWRGTGDIEKPFFERYHFENESTLVMESLADESLSKVNEVTRYELKDGQFGNGRAVATALDETSITFASLARADDTYHFQRVSENSWEAILSVPASGNTPARQINYHMERWPQKPPQPSPRVINSGPEGGSDVARVSGGKSVVSRQ